VPTDYYIDWSERAVERLQTLTIADRDAYYGKETTASNPDKVCSRFQNTDYYFRKGITSSRVGMYSPSYRLSAIGPFSSGCSNLYIDESKVLVALGVMCSRIYRFLFKGFVNHTVNSRVDDAKPIPIPLSLGDQRLRELVRSIVEKQKQDPPYDYMTHEQVEIDRLVYRLYNLSAEDVAEVEDWFWRRYSKLARAIERNR
jgi:hypothetical protein